MSQSLRVVSAPTRGRPPVRANRDVVDIILHSREDWTALDYANFACVSAAWAEAVYRPLYEDVILTQSNSCVSLLRTLKVRPELAKLIKKMIVSITGQDTNVRTLAALFRRLQLTELVVDGYVGVVFTSVMFDVACSTNLKHLHICGDVNITQLHVDTIFKTFQRLERLTIEEVCLSFTDIFESEDEDVTEKVWPFYSDIFQAEIVRPNGEGNPFFRGLWIQTQTVETFNDILRKLHATRPSIRNLENLVVEFSEGWAMEDLPVLETYSDPYLPKLERFSISGALFPIHFAIAARETFENLRIVSILDCFRFFYLQERYLLPFTFPPFETMQRPLTLLVKSEDDRKQLLQVAEAYNFNLALIRETAEHVCNHRH